MRFIHHELFLLAETVSSAIIITETDIDDDVR